MTKDIKVVSVTVSGTSVLLGLAKGTVRVPSGHKDLPTIEAGQRVRVELTDDAAGKLAEGRLVEGHFLGRVVAESAAPVRSRDSR